jgi:inositol transport system ATP-binding protein
VESEFILEIDHVSKSFPGVKALDDVSFKLRAGTVHSLMGENGAGKSTIMKILSGYLSPDSGHITFRGQPLIPSSITHAIKSGIAMIYQELNSILDMTVAENIYFGREPTYGRTGVVNHRALYRQTAELLQSLCMNIEPKARVRDLSVAKMQLVEIAKAISYDSRLIIMDEPTSAITISEVDQLFEIIGHLKAKGVTIIYITHKMAEVFRISDEVTVLRDGKLVGTEPICNLSTDKLIHMMVGREITEMFPKQKAQIGEVVLSVRNFSRGKKFMDISFDVRSGEILGFSGLMGSGRSEVLESVFGITPHDKGEVLIRGKKVAIRNPADAIRLGMGFLTEDRKQTGCFLPLSVGDNMIMSSLDQFIDGITLNSKKARKTCEVQKTALNIKTPDFIRPIKNLSGGNQQKVLLARWLMINLDIIIVDEPTRGIDVNTKAEIHRILSNLASQGKAIIMVSSELPEILGMSDRIVVMHEGRIKGILDRDEATQEKIMQVAVANSQEKSSGVCV